jgi:hypothetical protein
MHRAPRLGTGFKEKRMSRLVGLLAAVAAVAAAIPMANAGVAPTHDVSQLSQSGAKIAPPRKAEEEPKKSEEQDQRKDDKR